MQPTFFRRICPSYDEPSFKAQFTFVLTHNRMFQALSNMPKQIPVDGNEYETLKQIVQLYQNH